QDGPDKVVNAIRREYAVGYLRWANGLGYTLRYASRVARPDGGEDIILATDLPVSFWWKSAEPPKEGPQTMVFQLSLDKNGHGEGKLAGKLTARDDVKT